MKNAIIKRTKRGWRFPSGIEVGDHNLPTMLRRIPPQERRLIPSKRILYAKVREAVARRAARVFGSYWIEQQKDKRWNIDWWTFNNGAHRKHFYRAWFGYERGYMPEDMLECAVGLRKCGRAFQFGKSVPVNGAFGPFVLSTMLAGWRPHDPNEELLKADGLPVQTPIPLDRAYTGSRADRRMARFKRPSRVWEPGLLFDPDSGLYVPPELASDCAIDVDAEEQ